jgi:hypothetical protein
MLTRFHWWPFRRFRDGKEENRKEEDDQEEGGPQGQKEDQEEITRKPLGSVGRCAVGRAATAE